MAKSEPKKQTNIEALAEHHAVNRSTANRWRQRGLVRFLPDGGIDIPATDEVLKADHLGLFRNAGEDSPDLAAAQTRKQNALARLRELDVEEREGRLVDAEEARTLAGQLAEHTLARLKTAPARWPAKMAKELGVPVKALRSVLRKYLKVEMAEIRADIAQL